MSVKIITLDLKPDIERRLIAQARPHRMSLQGFEGAGTLHPTRSDTVNLEMIARAPAGNRS